MDKQQNNTNVGGSHENRLPSEIDPAEKRLTEAAHRTADRDIANDAELSSHSPNDDLDEGETARLGDDKDLV